MKNLFLTITLAGLCVGNAEAQKRMTLHEEFTGENCPACASTNPTLWALCDLPANQSKIIHIAYLGPIAGSGPFYKTPAPLATLDARRSYYTIPFGPYGRYDGAVPSPSCGTPPGASAGHPGCFSQAEIDAAAAIPSPFNIKATHYFNTAKDSVYGKVVITAVSAITGATQYKLRAAFTKSMQFTTAPGSNGEKKFLNMVRAMFPDADGSSIAASWTAGASVTYNYKGKISELDTFKTFSTLDSMFVVWVQNDADKTIKQAARSSYAPLSIGDIVSAVSEFSVFPNPANDLLNVQCVLANPLTTTITITNTLGQVVLERELEARQKNFNESISLHNISSGNYIITIATNGEKHTRTFTVSK